MSEILINQQHQIWIRPLRVFKENANKYLEASPMPRGDKKSRQSISYSRQSELLTLRQGFFKKGRQKPGTLFAISEAWITGKEEEKERKKERKEGRKRERAREQAWWLWWGSYKLHYRPWHLFASHINITYLKSWIRNRELPSCHTAAPAPLHSIPSSNRKSRC